MYVSTLNKQRKNFQKEFFIVISFTSIFICVCHYNIISIMTLWIISVMQ